MRVWSTLMRLLGVHKDEQERQTHMEIELIRSRNLIAHDLYRREKCKTNYDKIVDDVADIIRGDQYVRPLRK